jgi:hypothetical protein
MQEIIYLPLLDEGTDCWRPVQAQKIKDDVYEICSMQPEDENWAFTAGCRVRCRSRKFSSGETGLVAYELAKSLAD